jgi:hypothetical protein
MSGTTVTTPSATVAAPTRVAAKPTNPPTTLPSGVEEVDPAPKKKMPPTINATPNRSVRRSTTV